MLHIKSLESICQFLQKCLLEFQRDFIESVDQCGAREPTCGVFLNLFKIYLSNAFLPLGFSIEVLSFQ